MDKGEAQAFFREALGVLGEDAKAMMADFLGAQAKKTEERLRASDPVTIYAQRDIFSEDGRLVHPRGFAQKVPPVDKNEIVRGGLYAETPPRPEPLVAATETPKPTGSTGTAKSAPETAEFALTRLPNVNAKLARVLEDAKGEDGQSLNLATLEGFRAVKTETLAALPGVGTKMADILKAFVAENYKEE